MVVGPVGGQVKCWAICRAIDSSARRFVGAMRIEQMNPHPEVLVFVELHPLEGRIDGVGRGPFSARTHEGRAKGVVIMIPALGPAKLLGQWIETRRLSPTPAPRA